MRSHCTLTRALDLATLETLIVAPGAIPADIFPGNMIAHEIAVPIICKVNRKTSYDATLEVDNPEVFNGMRPDSLQ